MALQYLKQIKPASYLMSVGEAGKETVSPCRSSGRKKQLLAVMERLMCSLKEADSSRGVQEPLVYKYV